MVINMDRNSDNKGSKNAASVLLEKLNDDLRQNASDKETIIAEEAAAKAGAGHRYRFRVMKKAEYLEKKRIADKLASAADEADISDEDLEALLRSYLKTAPMEKPVIENTAEIITGTDHKTAADKDAPSVSGLPKIDLNQPLSKKEAPFYEESEPEVISSDPTPTPGTEQTQPDFDEDDAALNELLALLPDDLTEQPDDRDLSAEPTASQTDSVLSAQTAAKTPASASDQKTDGFFADEAFAAMFDNLMPEDTASKNSPAAESPSAESPSAEGSPAVDTSAEPEPAAAPADISSSDETDDLAALLASLPDDEDMFAAFGEPAPSDATADNVQTTAADDNRTEEADHSALTANTDDEAYKTELIGNGTDDGTDMLDSLFGLASAKDAAAISDEELESMLAAIENEDAPSDAAPNDTAATAETVEPTAVEPAAESDAAEAPDTSVDAAADGFPDDLLDDIPDTLLSDSEAGTAADAQSPDTFIPADKADATEAPAAADIAADQTDAAANESAETPDDAEFDQTDLDLMIAFGMEDQLEKAVGHERAKKYKKAIGERGENHYNEMHMGDRPDTVQDRHAEYVSSAQNKEIFAEYKKKYGNIMFRFLGAFVFLIALFFFENDQLLGMKMPAIFDREQYPLVYTLFDLQLVVLSGAMVWKGIRTGIRAMLRARPVPESITGFLFIACIIDTVIIAALCPMHGLQLYNFPIALAVLFELFYEYMNLRREIMSFKIVSSKKLKYAVDAIAPKDGEAERRMFAEYISDDPSMFRIKRTAFVEGFFQRTETYPRTQRILRAILPVVLLLTLAFFAAEFILSGSVYSALTVSYITLLLTLPSCAFIMFSYPMYRASGFAYEKDSAMIGEASLGEYADASVVSFDDKEVFPARGVRVRNVKVYGNNRIDHVIYAAASVFHVVGGPLSDVFETATGELGYAENVRLVRLDRDGIEARVDGGTVLVGRAAFVNRYGYNVSLSESETSMEETGDASILYVAYDNNIAAKLYIQYAVEPDFEVVLKQLYRQGICVGIKTSDPNIDDHLLSCKIKMSKYPVRIIKCAEPKETAIIVDRLSSGIVSKSSAKSLLQTLAICDRVLSASRTNNVLGVVSILLGMAAMAFFIIAGMPITVAPLFVALYQLFWIIPVIAVARYYI